MNGTAQVAPLIGEISRLDSKDGDVRYDPKEKRVDEYHKKQKELYDILK